MSSLPAPDWSRGVRDRENATPDLLRGEVIPADERERMVERAARTVYAKRPFRTASRRSAWEEGIMDATTFDWDEAPAFYQAECREIAATVLNAVWPPALP